MLQEATHLANKLEDMTSGQTKSIFEQKKEFYHKFNEEKDLHKYCLKSKEIKSILSIVFGVYNFCEENQNSGMKSFKTPNPKSGIKALVSTTDKQRPSFGRQKSSYSETKPTFKKSVKSSKSKNTIISSTPDSHHQTSYVHDVR